MSGRIRNWLAAVAVSALWLVSCGDSNSAFDKNTNWLRGCDDSAACGVGLHCVCGVCTSVCDRDDECAAQAEHAICVAPAASSSACSASETASAQRVCSLPCQSDDACTEQDKSLRCVSGACMRKPVTDAGAGDRDGSTMETPSPNDAGRAADAALPVGDAAIIADDGGGDVDPQTHDAIAMNCGAGFSCTATIDVVGSIASLVPDADGFVYWTDWGTLDELGNHHKDGAIRRVAKDGGSTEDVQTGLTKPWRLWLDAERVYWLSGEPNDFAADTGMQTLYEAPRTASAAPRALKTDPFSHVQMHGGIFTWQSPTTIDGVEPVPGIAIHRWNPHQALTSWEYTMTAGPYILAGADDDGVYLENRPSSIVRLAIDGAAQQELVTDPPCFLTSVGDDALYVIHLGSDAVPWVSSLPKTGGDLTNVGSAENYPDADYGRPQPGASVVWLVTGDGSEWRLWSIPKAGGEREPVFSWPANTGVGNVAPLPIWIADADEAFVFAEGALVRVRRE